MGHLAKSIHLDFFCYQWKGTSEVPLSLALPCLRLVFEQGAAGWLLLDKLYGQCSTAPAHLDWDKVNPRDSSFDKKLQSVNLSQRWLESCTDMSWCYIPTCSWNIICSCGGFLVFKDSLTPTQHWGKKSVKIATVKNRIHSFSVVCLKDISGQFHSNNDTWAHVILEQ